MAELIVEKDMLKERLINFLLSAPHMREVAQLAEHLCVIYASAFGRLQLLQNKGIEYCWFESNLPAQIYLLFRIHTAIYIGKMRISFT